MRTFAKKPKANQQTTSTKSFKPSQSFLGQSRDVHSILHLQRTIGNQAVLRLLQPEKKNIDASLVNSASTGFAHDFSQIPVQATAHSDIKQKLKVNAARDQYEQEADRIADEVLRQQTPEEEYEKLDTQVKSLLPATVGEYEVNTELENRLNRSKGGGSAISDQVRAFFAPRLQFDFSKVRVHTNLEAARMNQELGARAFTHGRDIYFGVGQYNPQSIEGKRLMAHELTHVVQQSNTGSVSGQNSVQSHNISKAKNDIIQCSIEPHPEISGDFIITTNEGIGTESEFIRQVRRDLGSKVMRSRLREDRPASDLMRIGRFEERLSICWNGELSLRRPSNRQIVVRLEGWGGRVSRFILISPRVGMPSPEESREPGEETLPPLQLPQPPSSSDVESNPPSRSPEEEAPATQNIVLDGLGWLGDLVLVAGWWVGASVSREPSRAANHLLHSMFFSGEPVEVPVEWIMDSNTWREGYRNLRERWFEHVVSDAVTRAMEGEAEGSDYYSDIIGLQPMSQCEYMWPWCQEADQFFASGNAAFTVEGGYRWHQDEWGVVAIEMNDITGHYEDHYVWHEANPGELSRQERGWYTPFTLRASWGEEPRVERCHPRGSEAEEQGCVYQQTPAISLPVEPSEQYRREERRSLGERRERARR